MLMFQLASSSPMFPLNFVYSYYVMMMNHCIAPKDPSFELDILLLIPYFISCIHQDCFLSYYDIQRYLMSLFLLYFSIT
jgi:hypothetical protein